MINPFRYGTVVQAEHQCPRLELLERVLELLHHGQRVVLPGVRRTGKSSFLRHVVGPASGRQLLWIDLRGIPSSSALVRVVQSALDELKFELPALERLKKYFLRSEHSLHAGPYALKFPRAEHAAPQAVDDVMAAIGDANRLLPLIVVIDEFQDVLRLPDSQMVLGRMRAVIQLQEVPYVFAGSIRTGLHGIFARQDSAFFKSATIVDFPLLETETFGRWLRSKFALVGCPPSDDALHRIFEATGRISGDVQQLCHAVCDVVDRGASVTPRTIEDALELILDQESGTNAMIWDELTPVQQRCLSILALAPELPETGGRFARLARVAGPSTVAKAFDALTKSAAGLIYREERRHRFFSPFFAYWVARQTNAVASFPATIVARAFARPLVVALKGRSGFP